MTVTNEDDDNGVMYVIPPTYTVPFGEADSSSVSPLTKVTIGYTGTSPPPQALAAGVVNSILRLSFSNLKVANFVNIGGASCSATPHSLSSPRPVCLLR